METIDNFLKISYGYGSGYGSGSGDGYGSGDGDGSGDGYGYGDGSGYGSGDGYGDGYGSGDGYGYGSGYGSGDGSGYGSGDGDGSGDGSGYGYGYGDGDGSGYGDGIIQFDEHKVYNIDHTPTIITNIHGNIAQGYVLNKDLTITPCYVAKCGNFFAHGDTVHEAMRDAREKYEVNLPVSERISRFIAYYPTLDTVCSNSELFVAHNRLTGSCEMGRREFCKSHSISLDGEMTVAEFIRLTAGEYGGDIIRQLKEAYR